MYLKHTIFQLTLRTAVSFLTFFAATNGHVAMFPQFQLMLKSSHSLPLDSSTYLTASRFSYRTTVLQLDRCYTWPSTP